LINKRIASAGPANFSLAIHLLSNPLADDCAKIPEALTVESFDSKKGR